MLNTNEEFDPKLPPPADCTLGKIGNIFQFFESLDVSDSKKQPSAEWLSDYLEKQSKFLSDRVVRGTRVVHGTILWMKIVLDGDCMISRAAIRTRLNAAEREVAFRLALEVSVPFAMSESWRHDMIERDEARSLLAESVPTLTAQAVS